jgi:hypothetical protein
MVSCSIWVIKNTVQTEEAMRSHRLMYFLQGASLYFGRVVEAKCEQTGPETLIDGSREPPLT